MKAYARMNANTQEVELIDVPIPDILSDEVLVKIEAFGVGIHDRYFIPANARFPYVIGSEGSGKIVNTGNQVNRFSSGERVIFTTVLQPQGGTWAEFAAAKRSALIHLPDEISFETGATVPIAGRTALECMRELELNKGDTLFIAGASGAIGTFVIQMAVAAGVKVAGSASALNQDYMRSLGADKVVDYRNEKWESEIKKWSNGGVDAALAIQPGTGNGAIDVVKDGGELITVSGDNHTVPPQRQIVIRQMGHHPDTNQKAEHLLKLIAEKRIKVVIEKEYPFEKALEALQKTETRHARGKLIVNGKNN